MSGTIRQSRAWVIYSIMDKPTLYTRHALVRAWKRTPKIPFFFDWGSGHVYMRLHPSDPTRTYEQIHTMRELLERARRDGVKA